MTFSDISKFGLDSKLFRLLYDGNKSLSEIVAELNKYKHHHPINKEDIKQFCTQDKQSEICKLYYKVAENEN